MGRPSKLSPEQWLLAEHRHVVDRVPINALARELGLSATALRRKIKPSMEERARGIPTLRALAQDRVVAERALAQVDDEIAELPETRQIIVHDLVARIKSITVHLTCAAEDSAYTSRKLTALARAQSDRIDPTKPINDKVRDQVSAISAITRTANEAGSIGMGLIAAHRVGLPGASESASDGVVDLTDEELDAELRAHGIDPANMAT